MNWRFTLWLAVAAVAAAIFVFAIERPARLGRARAAASRQLLPDFQPAAITTLRIQTTNLTVVLTRTNGLWEISGPQRHPAQAGIADTLLRRVSELQGRSILTTAELRSRPEATADFGLNPPAATMVLEGPGRRTELLLGIRSLNGSQVHYQVSGIPGIYVADAALIDALPRDLDGWRDTMVLPLDRLAFDRVRVAADGTAFTLSRDPTNSVWHLLEPRPARADSTRVGMLLRQLALLQIGRFVAVTSAPAADLAGFQPPRVSLTLLRGTNEIYGLELGAPLTNGPAPSVFARRVGEADLLVLSSEAQDLLRIPYKELLDRRLVRVDRHDVREIEFAGAERFGLVLQEDTWRLVPSGLAADPALVDRLLHHLSMFEMIDIAKEVVTDLDLASYGLAPPARRIVLRSQAGVTNIPPLAVLETGAVRDNRVFARVPGEAPVYLVNPADLDEIPRNAWELRDLSLWRFDSGRVATVTARRDGADWTVRRIGTNDWSVPPGARNEINPFALEEALHRFGETRLVSWRGLGEGRAQALGVGRGPELTLEFRGGPTNPPLRIRFGKAAPGGRRYASTTLSDGSQPVFEIPGIVFDDLWRELGMPSEPENPVP